MKYIYFGFITFLLEIVYQVWKKLTKLYKVRQIHFLKASFLHKVFVIHCSMSLCFFCRLFWAGVNVLTSCCHGPAHYMEHYNHESKHTDSQLLLICQKGKKLQSQKHPHNTIKTGESHFLVQLSNNFLTFGRQFGFIDLIPGFRGEEHLLRQTAKKTIAEIHFLLLLV